MASLCLLLLADQITFAASLEPSEEKLVLSPPHAEIPPSFWEQYGVWLIVIAFLALVLIGLAVAWKLRPKPPVIIPIEVRTREELESLRQRPEDGRTLSRISRALRNYFTISFELPPEEMTTAEFRAALTSNEMLGSELANQAGEFLRRCDQLKFAPDMAPGSFGAADQALKLVEAAEARRALLKEVAASQPPVIP